MKAILLILVLLAGAYAQSNSVNIDSIDSTCTLCTTLVGTVEDAINADDPQSSLLLILAESCDDLKEAALVSSCKNIVSSVGSTLIQNVIDNKPASVICQELNLCTSATLDEQIEMLEEVVEDIVGDNSTTCTICQDLVSAVESAMADNTTQPFLLLILAQTCDALAEPPLVALCQALVNKFGPELINYVVANQPASVVCPELDMCSSDDVIQNLEAPEFFHVPVVEEVKEDSVSDDSFECQICGILVAALEAVVETNTSESFLIGVMQDACELLPSSTWEAQCKTIVGDVGQLIIKYVLEDENATVICQQVGLCNSSVALAKAPEPLESVNDDSLSCQICDALVAALETAIQTNTSETFLIAELDQACAELPSLLNVLCQGIVKTYAPQMIQWVLAGEDAETVCDQLDLCNDSSTFVISLKTIEKLEEDFDCMVCGILVSVVEDVVKFNMSQEFILSQMVDACDKLPSSTWASQCKTIVSQVGLQIIQDVLADETASVICQQVGLCPNTSAIDEEKLEAFKIQIAEESKTVTEDFDCDLCGILVNALEQAVQLNASEQFLTSAMYETCIVILIPSWKKDCQTIVNTSGPALIQWVLQKEDPKIICQQVGLCPNSSSIAQVQITGDDYSCELCNVIGAALDSEANGSQTESYLFGVMMKSCATLRDHSAQKDCQDLIFNYGSQMIRVYERTQNGTEMCNIMNFCNSSELSIVSDVGDEIVCAACTWVVTRAEHWLESNKTETEILDLIEKDCDILIDKKWVDSCKDTVGKYGGAIIQRIVADSPPPNVICTDIDLCPSNSTSPAVPAKPVNLFL